MSGKTLSTGTLSLRFMQNANRAKHLKEFELDRAEVVDAGKWEIGQDIRDTWGPIPNSSSQTVQHESSYLPFLFSESKQDKSESVEAEAVSNRPKGRRTFNRKGEEIEEVAAEGSSEIPSDTASPSPDRNSSRKVHPRPVAISFATTSSLHGLEEPKKHSKTAKQTIFENSNVGADIRSLSLAKPQPPVHPPLPNVFLKPAGIDDPLESKAPLSSEKAEPSIIDGARRKKPKRPRDPADPTHEENKRGRKKKKAIES